MKYDGLLRIDEDENSLACDFNCMRVEKNNSGKMKPQHYDALLGLWQVAEWRIRDAAFGQAGPYHADIWIQSVDHEDDIFGMLEVRRLPVLSDKASTRCLTLLSPSTPHSKDSG